MRTVTRWRDVYPGLLLARPQSFFCSVKTASLALRSAHMPKSDDSSGKGGGQMWFGFSWLTRQTQSCGGGGSHVSFTNSGSDQLLRTQMFILTVALCTQHSVTSANINTDPVMKVNHEGDYFCFSTLWAVHVRPDPNIMLHQLSGGCQIF